MNETMKNIKKPELLAPAGNWKALRTAIKYGADAVYFGVENLNMRAKAANFKVAELKQIVEFCHQNNVDAHLTLNTIVFEDELEQLDKIIPEAKKAGIDFIICWDTAVINKCLEYEVPFCVSTQASISNSSAAKFYKRLGAKRIVLARECSLEKIKEIKNEVDIEIETFVHGAMCVAISGRCFMSHDAFGKSANRGECIQPCRREFEIVDKDESKSFIIGEDYVMSPKDLCAIDFIDLLIEAGIDSFKIEGRKRSPEYIAKVVGAYRKAIDLYFEERLTIQSKKDLRKDLEEVYNRGFSSGFYFDVPGAEEFTDQYGSKATTRKQFVGKVINYFQNEKVAHVKILSNKIDVGDKVYFIGNTTALVEAEVSAIRKDDAEVLAGEKGEEVTFKVDGFVRPGDQVYKVIEV